MNVLRRIIAALTARRCQTCGRKVETYCHKCEDQEADWTDPEA